MAVNFNHRIRGRQSRVTSPSPTIPAEKEPCSPAQPIPGGDEPAAEQETQGDGKAHRHVAELRRADSADGRETGREKADGHQGLQKDHGNEPGPSQGSQKE